MRIFLLYVAEKYYLCSVKTKHNLTMCKITNFSVNNQEKSEKFHSSTEKNFKIEANADAMTLSRFASVTRMPMTATICATTR